MLGVSRPTLYAYVSRGLLRSEPHGNGRQRRYARADIDRLISRRHGAGGTEAGTGQAAETRLLPSAITLIAEGNLYYRGRDAVALADAVGLEGVARLLWQCDDFDPFPEAAARLATSTGTTVPPVPSLSGMPPLPPLPRLLASLPSCEAMDPQSLNHGRQGCARTGARLLYHALDTLVPPLAGPRHAPRLPIHTLLAQRWMEAPAQPDLPQGDPAGDLLRRALVLCADHEFNPSTFAARCVAGTGASVYAATCAALAALQGPRHGGTTQRIAAFLARLETVLHDPTSRSGPYRASKVQAVSPQEVEGMIAAHLARGEELPGFGHPLYPAEDPRARALLRAIARARPDDPQWLLLEGICRAVTSLTDQGPNIDFALVALARVLGLPEAAPITLFTLGRIVGWVAHVEEQYRDGRLLRPRAAYTGPPPG